MVTTSRTYIDPPFEISMSTFGSLSESILVTSFCRYGVISVFILLSGALPINNLSSSFDHSKHCSARDFLEISESNVDTVLFIASL